MNKWILLKFLNNNGEGYRVLAELWVDNSQILQLQGTLSLGSSVFDTYRRWKALYQVFFHRSRSSNEGIAIDESGITNVSHTEFDDLWKNLKQELDRWLGETSFAAIDLSLRSYLNTDEDILINIQTDDPNLWFLPWPRWNFLEDFRRAEVILSPLKNISVTFPKRNRIRLLAIFGDDTGIDTERDSILLERLKKRGVDYLDLKKKLNVKALDVRSIVEALRDRMGWSVLFFAGHSSSSEVTSDSDNEIIQLDPDTPLRLTRIETALRNSIKNGLQLAIFNSCNGIGLARKLLDWNLPRAIVMREEVPNEVAVEFLKHFLDAFARGDSLPIALRRSRESLEGLEHEYPYATWLPVLCQNATVPLLTWESLGGKSRRSIGKKIVKSLKTIGLVAGGFTLGFLAYPGLNPIPTESFDASRSRGISVGEEILFDDKRNLNRSNSTIEKGIQAFKRKDYKEATRYFILALEDFPDNPEIRIYYNNARALQDKDPLKIAVSVPLGNNPEIAREILRGVALFQQELNEEQSKNPDFHSLLVVIANDNNNREMAKDIAGKFVKDKSILAVIGHNASDASEAARDIYYQGGIVAISPTSFSEEVKGERYIYKMVPNIGTFAATLSEYIREKSNVVNPRTFICYDGRSGDNYNLAGTYRSIILGQNFQSIIEDEFSDCNIDPKTRINYENVYESMKANRVNVFMIAPYVNDLDRAIDLLVKRPSDLRDLVLIGSPTFQTNLTLEKGQKNVEGLVTSVPWYELKEENTYCKNSDPRKERECRQRFNVWRTPSSYDATEVIVEGLKKLSSPESSADRASKDKVQKVLDRESLAEVLRHPAFKIEGMTGTVQFTRDGIRKMDNNPDRRFLLLQICDGQFVPLGKSSRNCTPGDPRSLHKK
ncbi:CHAT domain-containing protein [Pannus brasiliensis CCIBt3594]|uniref:CHAT domain-containing protein n=1 Tax=Pannus brasiliensis CCIBt3594 TaxID=1427578 RepID=A0AAW9QXK7_9CHRO